MASEFWFELGCEEIPARTMARSIDDLKRRLEKFLRDENLEFDRLEAMGSARRFVLHIPSLADRQPSRTERVLGPAARIAYNDGQPSPALQGFARKNNVALESLQTFSTDRGDYVGFENTVEGASASSILSRGLYQIVKSMSFPRMMTWMDPAQRFSRPVRWIVARHGGEPIPLELFGVQSGKHSEGHRVLGSGRIEVGSYGDFIARLEENFVIVSDAARSEKIQRELQEEAGKLGGRIIGDDRLLEEVVFINEYPTVLVGGFEPRFLELPREILVTVMKEHQKYFAVEDSDGALMPYFLAIVNTASDPKGYIRKGHERVMRARLTDAMFFLEVDRKQTLESRRARLKSIVFQEKLGSYADKVRRVTKLARKVNTLTKARVPLEVLAAAAQWSKSDLTCDMVREFTELQGIVGGLYARGEGAAEDVWRAIYDQYRPQSLEDRSPATRSGAVLSISDKLDTVLSCFAVGLIPTGSEDPLGLRRAMQGAIKVLLDHRLPFSFEKASGGSPTPELRRFFEDRLRFILEQRGFAYDEVNAAMAPGADDPSDVLARLEAIRAIRSSADFEAVSAAFKRIKNILRQAEKPVEAKAGAASPEEDEVEAALASFLEGVKPQIFKLAGRRQYLRILELMAGGRPVIDRFFDKLRVMHEDPEVRRRRLQLLTDLLAAFSRVADISEIVVQGT